MAASLRKFETKQSTVISLLTDPVFRQLKVQTAHI
jgi:hypothetical protein